MISNQILQNTIDGLKGITRVELGICDPGGKVLVSTSTELDITNGEIVAFAASPADKIGRAHV